jgi:RNA polymerase sigma-70 factor (ECF subfamily)
MENLVWYNFIKGNNKALDGVFTQHYVAMLFTAVYYLKNESSAQDVVADVFKKLLEMNVSERKQKLGGVNEKLEVFLKVLVKNKCLDTIKVEKNRLTILNSIHLLFSRSLYTNELIHQDFEKMLDVLPNQQRKVLELHLKGFENEEISKQLGMSYNTCRNTLSTSKKKIRVLWSTFMD